MWVLKRHDQMGIMNDGPAWDFNSQPLTCKKVNTTTELIELAEDIDEIHKNL